MVDVVSVNVRVEVEGVVSVRPPSVPTAKEMARSPLCQPNSNLLDIWSHFEEHEHKQFFRRAVASKHNV